MIKPDADIYTRFFTYNSSGVLTDDDGTPAGVLVKNGTDTAETVTVTKLTTGSYKAAFIIPSDAVTGDVFELQITVTMSTVVQKDIIWRDIVDTYANSDVVTELRNTSGFEKIVPKIMLIPTADSNVYMVIVVADSPDNSEVGVNLVAGNNAILYEDDALTTPLSASVTFENYMVMPSLNANIYLCYVKVDHTETAKQYNYVFVYAKNSVEYSHTAETSLIDEDVVVKSLSTNVITADSIKTDAITEIQNGLATGVDLATVDGIVDAIKLKTDGLNFTGTDVKATLDSEKVAVSSLDNDVITAAAIKTDAITEIQSGLATSLEVSTVDGKVDGLITTVGVAGAGLTALGDTRIENLDAAITTRLADADYTAPDNTSITAIKGKTDSLSFTGTDVNATLDGETVTASTVSDKTGYALTEAYDAAKTAATQTSLDTVDGIVDAIKLKTDNLPADPASNTQVNTRMETFVYTAPDNASIADIKAQTDQLTFSFGDVVATLNGETVTASTVSDKTGYTLTEAYDAAKTAATQASLDTVDGIVDAVKAKTDNLPADPASTTDVNTRMESFTYTAPDNASITAIKAVTDKLDDTLELDTDVYKFTANALEEAPTGEGGGGFTETDRTNLGNIKTVTDKINFNVNDDVIATLDGETVAVSSIGNNVITAASINSDAVTELQAGLATSSALSTVDTVVDAIKVRTDLIPNDPATETSLSGIEDKIDALQSSVETGNSDTPTVEEIVEGILTGAIDGNIDLQTATKKILSVISNNMYATVDSTDILYEYKNSDNTETVVTFRVAEDGTSRESE